MNYCEKCGSRQNIGERFCSGCGAPNSMAQAGESNHGINNTSQNDNQVYVGAGDNTKLFSILAYILFFIPLIVGAHKTSDFVKFHTNQGTVLAITFAIYIVANMVVNMISSMFFPLGLIFGFALTLVGLGLLVLAIIGIVNVVNDKMVQLPIIGRFVILK